MGLFGGKKKQSETEQVERRTTRRAVVPGGKPAAAGDQPAKAESRGKAVIKPGTVRASRSDSSGLIRAAGGGSGGDAKDKASAAAKTVSSSIRDGMLLGSPTAPAPIPTASSERPSRGPIQVDQSKPPEFTGALTTAKSGPCRTGDAALMEFLCGKAKLFNEAQADAVRQKAQDESLAIDMAAVQMGLLTEEQMVNALTQECWVPHLKVDKYEIRKKALDTITREDASYFGVFPVDKLGSLLTLAMINPLDTESIRILESKTGLGIKKVVATRSEITQGIEKYYSGLVQAKDGSMAFTQDIEPKSVTAMMARVSPAGAPPSPSRPMVAATSPSIMADSIVPEIQDIDDLLAGDEAIAPAIIEPISLKAEITEITPVEVVAVPTPVRNEGVTPLLPIKPSITPTPSVPAVIATEFQLDDASPTSGREATLTPKALPPAAPLAPTPALPPAAVVAPEFLDFSAPAITAPVIASPAIAAPASSAPAIAAPASAAPAIAAPAIVAPASAAPAIATPAIKSAPAPTALPARPSAPMASPAAAPSHTPSQGTRSHSANKGLTSRFSGSSRIEQKSGVINLIPVMEEEFQHAITHGKARVFEKWVGLQTRNRIINAVAVESELDDLLAGLYAGGKTL